MSKPLNLILKEKVEELENKLQNNETEIKNLLSEAIAGDKTLKDSYKNYKKLCIKIMNTESPSKCGIFYINTKNISSTETYVISAFQDTQYNISASITFKNDTTVNIKEIKNTGWTFYCVIIDGIN